MSGMQLESKVLSKKLELPREYVLVDGEVFLDGDNTLSNIAIANKEWVSLMEPDYLADVVGRSHNESRRYWYENSGGFEVAIKDIFSVLIKKDGMHVVRTESGNVYYIKPLWQTLSIDTK